MSRRDKYEAEEQQRPQRRARRNPWQYKVVARRREEAEVRQEARDARGDEGQLARLDEMFGAGKGAQRERARLVERLGGAFGGERAA